LKAIFVRKGVFAPRWIIVVLPVLAALGPYALPFNVGGINWYAFRVLILLMAAFSTPLTSASGWWFNTLARRAMLLGVLWVTYGMLSLLWTPDLAGGMADVMSIGFGFALLLILFNVRAYESQQLQLLRIAWVLAFVVTAAVAIWEIVTGQHLHSNMYEGRPQYFDGSVVQSTLGRPEPYGMFLLAAVPFLLWSFYEAKGAKKLAYAGLVAAACILVLFTGSRLTFIGLAAELLLLVFIFDRRWYVVMLGSAAMVIGFVWWSNVFLSSDLRLASKFDSALSDMEDDSIEGRLALTLNGLWLVYDTAGLGVGGGGFPLSLVHRDVPFGDDPGSDGSMAHNLWVQIASEYGILPAAGLAALFLFVARLALQAANCKWPGAPHEIRVLGIVTLVGLVGYLFYGVVGGGPLRQSAHWMFFASLVVIAVRLHQARAMAPSGVRERQGRASTSGVVARALR
jgi:hypothetical protein